MTALFSNLGDYMEPTALYQALQNFGNRMTAAPADVILEQDEPAEGAYLVTCGKVCVSLNNDDGVPIWTKIAGEGTIVGLASALARSFHMFHVVAVDAAELVFIPRDKLAKLIIDNQAVGSEIIGILSAEELDVRRKWSMLRSQR